MPEPPGTRIRCAKRGKRRPLRIEVEDFRIEQLEAGVVNRWLRTGLVAAALIVATGLIWSWDDAKITALSCAVVIAVVWMVESRRGAAD